MDICVSKMIVAYNAILVLSERVAVVGYPTTPGTLYYHTKRCPQCQPCCSDAANYSEGVRHKGGKR
jgi:hypothetical protein